MPTLSSLDPHTPGDQAWGLWALQTAAGRSGRMWGSGALQGEGGPSPGQGIIPALQSRAGRAGSPPAAYWCSPNSLEPLCAGLCRREGSGGVADPEEDPSEGPGGGAWEGSGGGVERGRQTLTGR